MLRTRVLAAVLAGLVISSGGATAAAAAPIGPREHFAGLVNGVRRGAVVYTVCPGPGWPGRTGPVAGGQTMAVTRVPRGHGFTGPFSHIYSWFAPTDPAVAPIALTFTTYDTAVDIPTAIYVPCDGPGRVQFSSCPYHAPCAAGWVPTEVRVQFVNIAALHGTGGS